MLFLSLLSVAVGLFALDGQMSAWSRHGGRENLAALDFSARGSLAAWFGSMMLTLAAATGVFVFLLRRHKVDDYRGRYRFWLWSSALLVLAAIDAATGIHRIAVGLLMRSSGWLPMHEGAMWSVILGGVLFGPLALRGVFEIRQSRGATALLLLATGLYVLAAVIAVELVVLPGTLASLVTQSALLLGRLITLMCVLIFARHVLLDAQGKLPDRSDRKSKSSDGSETAPSTANQRQGPLAARTKRRKLRVDASHAEDEEAAEAQSQAPQRSQKHNSQNTTGKTSSNGGRSTSPPAGKVSVDLDDEIAENPPGRKLSKAERRRLRKEQRRAKG